LVDCDGLAFGDIIKKGGVIREMYRVLFQASPIGLLMARLKIKNGGHTVSIKEGKQFKKCTVFFDFRTFFIDFDTVLMYFIYISVFAFNCKISITDTQLT